VVSVKKGDRFIQRHPEARWPLFIEVTRVGKAGWVDIRVCTWAVMWTKRMPEGLGLLFDPDGPAPIVPEEWTLDDVRASQPEAQP
jgi:hypothetical protein